MPSGLRAFASNPAASAASSAVRSPFCDGGCAACRAGWTTLAALNSASMGLECRSAPRTRRSATRPYATATSAMAATAAYAAYTAAGWLRPSRSSTKTAAMSSRSATVPAAIQHSACRRARAGSQTNHPCRRVNRGPQSCPGTRLGISNVIGMKGSAADPAGGAAEAGGRRGGRACDGGVAVRAREPAPHQLAPRGQFLPAPRQWCADERLVRHAAGRRRFRGAGITLRRESGAALQAAHRAAGHVVRPVREHGVRLHGEDCVCVQEGQLADPELHRRCVTRRGGARRTAGEINLQMIKFDRAASGGVAWRWETENSQLIWRFLFRCLALRLALKFILNPCAAWIVISLHYST